VVRVPAPSRTAHRAVARGPHQDAGRPPRRASCGPALPGEPTLRTSLDPLDDGGIEVLAGDRGGFDLAMGDIVVAEDFVVVGDDAAETAAVRDCVNGGGPYGTPDRRVWTAMEWGLEAALRPRGQLQKEPGQQNVLFPPAPFPPPFPPLPSPSILRPRRPTDALDH